MWRRHLMLLSLTALMLVAAGLQAQGQGKQPIFAGKWVLADAGDAKPAPATELEVRESRTGPRTVLTVMRQLPSGKRSNSYDVGLKSGAVGDNGQALWLSVTWEDQSLVIETGQSASVGHPAELSRETWSLAPDGLLTITSDRNGAVTVAKYRRK
jgi:hypothetical protein